MKEILKKKSTKVGIAVVILVVAIGIISISVRSAQKQREYDNHVEAAERYLTELDYEQAIAEYTIALEIEPNNEEVLNALEQTYLDYAQSLADSGEYEKAISVLEEGYAQTGRECLREKKEDVRNQQAQKEAEEQARIEEEKRIKEEEEKKKEELIELVESAEFYNACKNMESMLHKTYLWPYWGGWGISTSCLTDTQMEELCRQYLDILEPYKAYYGEDWYNHNFYNDPSDWLLLSELYFAVGEYELCTEIRNQIYEVTQCDTYYGRQYFSGVDVLADSSHEYEFDDYGRLLCEKVTGPNSESETIYEYGEHNRPVKITEEHNYNDGDKFSAVTEFEYDSEGRPLEFRHLNHDWRSGGTEQTIEITLSCIYNESGFTMNCREEDWHNIRGTSIKSYSQDYEIDEYGDAESVGEAYDKYLKPMN